MAAGHLDNSAIAIWFQPDFDFSNQEKIVGGCGRARPSRQSGSGLHGVCETIEPVGRFMPGQSKSQCPSICKNAFSPGGPSREDG